MAIKTKGEFGAKDGINILQSAENEYTIKYTLNKSGEYKIHVKYADEDIKDSPFTMKCYVPLNPTNLSVVDPSMEVTVGSPVIFTVLPVGDMIEEGEIEIRACSRKKNVTGKVEKKPDGSYLCTIEPRVAALYKVKITLDGENITGSPFKTRVVNPSRPENVMAYGPGLNDGCVGQEGSFTIETERAGRGALSVKIEGPKGAFNINMRHHPDKHRTALCQYNPKIEGTYDIQITWDGVHIRGSPFTVTVQQSHKRI